MKDLKGIFTTDKYARIEWIFFLFIWIVVPMLSDFEYAFNEAPHEFEGHRYYVGIIRRLVWGIFSVIPHYLFYKLAIQQLLLKKKFIYFLFSILFFIVIREFYTVYVMYGGITKLSFLPPEMIAEAKKYGRNNWRLHFTVSYLITQLLVMIALAYFIHHLKQQKQIQELKQLKTEADLQYLQSQLQPHFFFNTLNNIYALALQQSQQTAPMVARLSEMMRYVLYDTVKLKQSLTKEIDFLKNYITVQSIRYNEKITINFDSQGIDDRAMIEPLLLLPFVENAFKHGIEEELNRGFINIIILLNDDELTLFVKNSKATMTTDAGGEAIKEIGIGIENSRKRLALLYPGQHRIDIQETNETYEVVLTININ